MLTTFKLTKEGNNGNPAFMMTRNMTKPMWVNSGLKMPRFVAFIKALEETGVVVNMNGGCSTVLSHLWKVGASYVMDVDDPNRTIRDMLDKMKADGLIKPKAYIDSDFWSDAQRSFVFLGDDGKIEKQRLHAPTDSVGKMYECEPHVCVIFEDHINRPNA